MKRIIMRVNQGRRFLFHLPTKSIEFLNGLLALMFGLVFMMNGSSLVQYKSYVAFTYVGPVWLWFVISMIGVFQLNAMRKETLESNMLSAIVLKVSSLLWFLVAILFGSTYPPLSTGFFTYLIISLVCVLAGYELSAQNTYELLLRKEYRED